MQKIYQRIGKRYFRLAVIALVIGFHLFLFRKIEVMDFTNAPSLPALSPADLKQLEPLVERSVKLGMKLIFFFHLLICALFLLERWLAREYFAFYSILILPIVFLSSSSLIEAFFFTLIHVFMFYGLFYWRTIFENLELKSSFAMEESNQAVEHLNS